MEKQHAKGRFPTKNLGKIQRKFQVKIGFLVGVECQYRKTNKKFLQDFLQEYDL
ncbi:hypothetical protein [uncultured Oscillibacter sp.]|uniref:hypothetical protein n=1 Tax=uncultured Oscillibacter sp. TaxID=876091 RepID=UPI0025F400D8|nr:hypothetical protein [uncultured Oscillibacter sp.]